jgi:uncharacterized protein YndB with AHSA1/START domain
MARTDVASRVIHAKPEAIFAALIDREALSTWLPPAGMTGRFDHFDLRPGGSYRLILTYADAARGSGKATADSDIVRGRFVDIVPGVRVVQAVDFVSDDPAYFGTMTMTWELSDAADGTRVEVRAENGPAGISAEDHAAGLSSSLANLAQHLSARLELREWLIAYGTLTEPDGAGVIGVAVALQAPGDDAVVPLLRNGVMGLDAFRRVEVHDWEFGGRR